MRKAIFVAVVALLLGFALPAAAQDENPPCNVYAGYYYVYSPVHVSGTGGGTTGDARISPQVRAGGGPTLDFNFNGGGGQVACNIGAHWLRKLSRL